MTSPSVTALMPVHLGVAPDHLRQTLESLSRQTRQVDEVIVVEDGPLSAAHHDALDWLSTRVNVERVVLMQNMGAGVANQAGLMAAGGEWIVKVDADDILVPHRIEAQMLLLATGGVDVCGAAMLEFDGTSDAVKSIRRMPESHHAIARRMRFNNPINHPTAVYRRESALAVGGYPDFRFMQDYVLFARLLAGGARMQNMSEPLVLFRSGAGRRARRVHPELSRLEANLQHELHRLGIISRPRMLGNIATRRIYRRLPARFMQQVDQRLLARPISREGR